MKTFNVTGRILTQSNLFILLLIVLVSGVILWLIVSGTQIPKFFSLIGITVLAVYLGVNFEKNYFLFTAVIIFPMALFITAIPGLKAYELMVPGLFIFMIIHMMISKETGPGIRILPLPIIIFFILGLVSYLRNPSFPTQVFARSIDLGNFRIYWSFFMGIMTYILAFYLFKRDRDRKTIFVIKFLTWAYVLSLFLHLGMTFFKVDASTRFFLVNWGPVPEGFAPGNIVFRSATFGWYGLNLFIILLAFPGYPKSKIIKGGLFLLTLICIILSGARATLLSAAFCVILLCILKKKFLRLIIPMIVVTVILVISYSYPRVISSLPWYAQRIFTIFPSSEVYGHPVAIGSARVRLQWWQEAVDIISQHPLTGMGFEKLERKRLYLAYEKYAVKIGDSHNAYIATGVMLGLPGILLLIWIFYLHLKRGIVLYLKTAPSSEKVINLWLVLMLFSLNIIYLFAGAPQSLFRYLFYAGLVNLNWCLSPEKDAKVFLPEASSKPIIPGRNHKNASAIGLR